MSRDATLGLLTAYFLRNDSKSSHYKGLTLAQARGRKKADDERRSRRLLEAGGRVPPHSPEMERAVLCACLIDPNGLTKVIDILGEKSFYEHRHQLIYDAMVALFQKSAPVDALTVAEELERNGQLETCGGDVYLAQLSGELATSAHIEHYGRIVQERSSLRALITISTQISEEAFDLPPAVELLETAMSKIYEISSDQQTGGFEPIRKPLDEMHKHLDKLHAQKHLVVTGVGTGFDELDEMTSGFQPGDLIVVAGRPSMGKTAFSLDIARNAAMMYQVSVAFFSLEMASMAIAMRLVAAEARISLHRLRSGKLPDKDWSELSLATGRLSELNFFIDDSGSLGINELRARARRLKQQHNIGIIFVDYLQLMRPPDAQSREQEVAQISRALKGLARELRVPVVALSQLSRAVETRGGDKIPQLADLRDSGAIEQDADLVMFIHRKKQYSRGGEDDEGEPVDNIAEIIIRKQRNGPTGTIKLVFNDEYTRFENRADSRYDTSVAAPYRTEVDVGEEVAADAPF